MHKTIQCEQIKYANVPNTFLSQFILNNTHIQS